MKWAAAALVMLLIAQQQANLSENFWIKALETTPLLIAALTAAGTAAITGIGSMIQNWRLKKQQNTIKENTDGKLSDILKELEEALSRNILLERELQSAYAILSAREGKPVMRSLDVARAEDFGLPPRGNGGAHPQRRHADQVPPEERRGEKSDGE